MGDTSEAQNSASRRFLWFSDELKTDFLICSVRVGVEILTLGIGTIWRTDDLKLDHEVIFIYLANWKLLKAFYF